VQFLAVAGIVAVLLLASRQVSEGLMTPSQLVSFLLYGQLMTRPIAGLADVYGRTQAAKGACGRLT
jgi:ABC-type bacteriocin/lantibiotic exporter with double-glycine peptidase domain